MDLYDAMHTSASGLSAQRLRMNLISANLANVNTTRTPEGGPYRRKEVVFSAVPKAASFGELMKARQAKTPCEVRPLKIIEDQRPPVVKYAPHHPDANAEGYVALPQVNVMEEMVNMISATRSYEANVSAVRAAKDMALKALEIGK
jgi:flagellar basal-body rod protein FlgC